MDSPRAVVFDLYGTLLDVSSVERGCGTITTDPAAFVALWRTKQLEYTWLRALSGTYVDFWAVTEDALRFTCRRLGVDPTPEQSDSLMKHWLNPAPYPEVDAALERLSGRTLAVLSNGSPEMLRAGLTSAGLAGRIAHLISVDEVRTYKPAPAVYALAERHLRLPTAEILFVSGNAWDAAGAKVAGLRVCRLNRAGLPMEELGLAPNLEVSDLVELADALTTK